MDLIQAAANLLFGATSEPIDWEAKRRSDEQRVKRVQSAKPPTSDHHKAQ